MSSSSQVAAPAPATASNIPQQRGGWFPFELNDNKIIEFAYRQTHDIIDKTKLPSSSAGGTFLCVKLYIRDVNRSYYFDDGKALDDDEWFMRSRTLHYVPYNDGGSDEEVQENLTRLLLDNEVPQEALTALGHMLPPFVRSVTAVNMGDCVVRPFLLDVGFVDVEFYDPDDTQLEREEFELLASQAIPMEEEDEPEFHHVDTLEKVTFEERSGMAEKCTVCYDEFRAGFDVMRLPCSHVYHQDCILRWLMTKQSCPMCRYELQY